MKFKQHIVRFLLPFHGNATDIQQLKININLKRHYDYGRKETLHG